MIIAQKFKKHQVSAVFVRGHFISSDAYPGRVELCSVHVTNCSVNVDEPFEAVLCVSMKLTNLRDLVSKTL